MRTETVEAALRQPLRLEPRLVAKPWGGQRLGPADPEGPIGEQWQVADLDPEATSVDRPVTPVATGPLAGATLRELIAAAPQALLGSARPVQGGFPLLVKLLDAGQHLSVQVHPPRGYVDEHPGARLKSESWVVLDAAPGAELFIGLEDGVGPGDLRKAAGTPELVPLLRRWPAVPGAVHHLPAGTIHALGAGTLVAEVQTPSDTTFRLYDWSEEYERAPRGLHVEQALACVEEAWERNRASALQPVSGDREGALGRTEGYELARRSLAGQATLEPRGGRAEVWCVVAGGLEADGLAGALGPGDVAVLPAAFDGALRAPASTQVLTMRP